MAENENQQQMTDQSASQKMIYQGKGEQKGMKPTATPVVMNPPPTKNPATEGTGSPETGTPGGESK